MRFGENLTEFFCSREIFLKFGSIHLHYIFITTATPLVIQLQENCINQHLCNKFIVM